MLNSIQKANRAIELYFSEDDHKIFNRLFSNSIEDLLLKITDWNSFFTSGKHTVSSLDEMGYSVLKSMIQTKIYQNYKSKQGLYNFSFGKQLEEEGLVVIEDYPIFSSIFLKELENFISILTETPSKFIPRYAVSGPDGTSDKGTDQLHVDLIYPGFKAFYYLEDTEIENGPFSFVPYSHCISYERMKMIKDASILRSLNPSLDPALRAEGDNLKYYLTIEKPIVAKAHTFILADTSGLHRRYPPSPGYSRSILRQTFMRNSMGDI